MDGGAEIAPRGLTMFEPMPIERRSLEDRRAPGRGGGRRDDDTVPVPLHELTTKQRQLLEAIARVRGRDRRALFGNYLARRFNTHHTSIRERLEKLYRDGWLKTPNAPASLRHPLE
jgi:hypothetical protein